jgi:hypothetical protein
LVAYAARETGSIYAAGPFQFDQPLMEKSIMKIRTHSLITLLCAASASLLIIGSPAQAGYIVTLTQVGPNVVATGSGAIDLTGLFLFAPNGFGEQAFLDPSSGFISTGPASPVTVLGDGYDGPVVGPTSFGSGFFTLANSGSGDFVAFSFGMPVSTLGVPSGYISGSALSDSATYNGATFASLGVTPGTYEWTWGTGANQNFTLKVVTATVPDFGSTFGLLFLSLAALFGAGHFRVRQPA